MEYINTVSKETYSNVLNLDTAIKVVFKTYITHLCKTSEEDLHAIEENNLTPERFKVWLSRRIPDLKNTVSTTWENDIKQYIIGESIGTLSTIKNITINRDTGYESDICLTEIFNCPASACLFTNYSGDSYITKDWNYKYYNFPGSSVPWRFYRTIDNELNKCGFDRQYWENNYSFSSGYDSMEYEMYNIDKILMPENKALFSAENCSYTLEKSPVNAEAIIVSYCFSDNYNIPVIYCDLHNAIRLMDGKLNIVWSVNGLISAENNDNLMS